MQSVSHKSSKEERDILLEYQSIDLKKNRKKMVLDIPIDDLTQDETAATIMNYLDSKSGLKTVLFLDPIKLIQLRPKSKLHRLVGKTNLILPEGELLGWFSGKRIENRVSKIALMMDLMRLSELKGYTLFFFGAEDNVLERVILNLSRHFPKARIVGRHAGFISIEREGIVKEAIRKIGADIVFLANSFPDGEIWIESNSNVFGNSVVISLGDAFDILSGMKKKAPASFALKGYTWLWRILARPWKLKKWYYLFLFLGIRIFQKSRATKG